MHLYLSLLAVMRQPVASTEFVTAIRSVPAADLELAELNSRVG
jgi:hypothetical protein